MPERTRSRPRPVARGKISLDSRDCLTLILAMLLAWVLADVVLKPLIGRQRPFVAVPAVKVIGGIPDDASFPSSHAASSFAAALVLATTAPAACALWWLLAIAMAYSRVYLGVHYPFDVMGGAAVGLISATVALWLVPRPQSS